MRGFQFQADPRVGYSFARSRRSLADSYGPMGANISPAIRDAQLRASTEDLGQQEAQALREENYGRQALDYARTADVAAMTQPRMVQERQSGTSSGISNTIGSGTVQQSNSPLGSIIQGGSTIGSALLM